MSIGKAAISVTLIVTKFQILVDKKFAYASDCVVVGKIIMAVLLFLLTRILANQQVFLNARTVPVPVPV